MTSAYPFSYLKFSPNRTGLTNNPITQINKLTYKYLQT